MSRRATGMLVCLLLGTTPNLAGPPEFEPDHLRSATDLLEVMGWKEQYEAAMKSMAAITVESPDDMDEYFPIIMDLMQKNFTWDTLGRKLAEFFAETFSEDELEGLISFSKTDLGKKLVVAMPAIMDATQSFVMERLFLLEPQIEKAIEEHENEKRKKKA